MLLSIIFNLLSSQVMASVEPPEDINHPGSLSYEFGFEKIKENFLNRESFIFLPKGKSEKSPVVFFGHGQALNLDAYEETFKHFAKKGYAMVFPKYDSGFFDQEWRRMAKDFNEISKMFLTKYSNRLNSESIHFSGHSKGAYIALMSAGAPNVVSNVGSLLLFSPAGYDRDYIKALPKSLPVSILWGERDDIIKKPDLVEIYENLEVNNKQFIEMVSYSDRDADHFVILNKSTFFGGKNGLSGFHFYGIWKWLGGAIKGLNSPYLYGDKAKTTGVDNLEHLVIVN